MLELWLLRHGETAWNVERRVMGRLPIGLNAQGCAQVKAVRQGCAQVSFDAAHVSPAQRTMETAELLLDGSATPIFPDEAFWEIDYGDWIEQPFPDADSLPMLRDYFEQPETSQIPGGERPIDAQARAVAGVESIRRRYDEGRVLVVSHADVIKATLVHFLQMRLNDWQRLSVRNASLSIVRFADDGVVQVECVNRCY